VLPLAAFIFYLKTFIGLAKSLEDVKPRWTWDVDFVLSVFPLHLIRGTSPRASSRTALQCSLSLSPTALVDR
jgi:hypothetical protein